MKILNIMTKNLNEIKVRIIQFVEYNGISVRKFCEIIDISPSNFSAKAMISSISADVLAKILNTYPQLDAYWLLLGRGNMIRGDHGSDRLLEDRVSKMEEQMRDIKCLFEAIKDAKVSN